jgi:tRNA nucleotidyltransferase/poly(A) polymerase
MEDGKVNLQEQVIAWLAQQDTAAYLVGGCVRDLMLGRSIYDLDVAVDGDGLTLARRLANHFGGAYYPLDATRGTGRAILRAGDETRLVVDVARFRGETLAADLAERDFTINALAADVRALDVVIDCHGGQADLRAGLIRPVSETSIRDDPVRALRAIRQAAQLGFALSSETERLIRRDGAALAQVSGERVRDEIVRLLALPYAALYLRHMDDLGLLTIVLPELEPLRDLVQPPPHHLDALAHSLETVRMLEILLDELQAGIADPGSGNRESGIGIGELGARFPVPDIRFPYSLLPFAKCLQTHLTQIMSDTRPRLITLKLAALLHDTGKPTARSVDKDGRIRFIDHQRQGVKLAGVALRRLRLHNAEVRLGETIVRHHMRPLLLAAQDTVSSRAVYRFFRDTGDAGVDVLLHALADHRATYAAGAQDDPWPRLVALTARVLADFYERGEERVAPPSLVDGNDLLRAFGLQSGPQIGELLEAVREAQVSGEVWTRKEALALIRERLDAEG